MTSGLLPHFIIYFLHKDILMNNKIVLISSYCNTDEKIKVLSENIDILKSIGVDVMLNSPIHLPCEIVNKCDYYFLNKENPVLTWPIKSSDTWWSFNSFGTNLRLTTSQPDYGWANIFQIKTLSGIALNFDYDYYYHIIYDLNITDKVVEHIKSEKICNFFHFHEWEVSLHFMIFNKDNLINFVNNISLEQYLEFGGIAETWLIDYLNKFVPNFIIEDEYVDEHIHFYTGINLFNYSPIKEIDFFISKDDNLNTKIHFYNLEHPILIRYEIDNQSYCKIIKNLDDIDITNTNKIILKYNDEIYDISEKVKLVSHNTFSLL